MKICASSRPWIVFEAACGDFALFKLQDLIYEDLALYVADRLSEHPRIHKAFDIAFVDKIYDTFLESVYVDVKLRQILMRRHLVCIYLFSCLNVLPFLQGSLAP